MPCIVIEGLDNSGKTTLANKFIKDYGYTYYHSGVPKKNENLFKTYYDILLRGLIEKIVADRLHVGEMVYGPEIRGASRISIAEFRILNRVMNAGGGVIVLCDVDEFVRRRDDDRVHYVKDKTLYPGLRKKFKEVCQSEAQCCYRSFDYSRDNIDRFSALVVMNRQPMAAGVNGSLVPRYLFVGEQPGGELDLAFAATVNSSRVLNESLWAAGYREEEMAFVNAFDGRGRPHDLVGVYNTFRQPRVIALGRVAQAACDKAALPHLSAPHPQYVKRFKSGQRQEYVDLLRSFR